MPKTKVFLRRKRGVTIKEEKGKKGDRKEVSKQDAQMIQERLRQEEAVGIRRGSRRRRKRKKS